jgi:hypothetical protein
MESAVESTDVALQFADFSWKVAVEMRQSTPIWLVVWNMAFIFPIILGISSSQLTNSYFSEG